MTIERPVILTGLFLFFHVIKIIGTMMKNGEYEHLLWAQMSLKQLCGTYIGQGGSEYFNEYTSSRCSTGKPKYLTIVNDIQSDALEIGSLCFGCSRAGSRNC